ncbi:hypothetical protein REJC140_02421 [Pseudorhizobium endolithicum]|uniref:Uncharacterized protein n=1 Tax=Pseudorhizobium endolithicum TaxID=1191678 RepID=A0ABM8PF92_9HYPH|nr:hypothetical protein [Pseudorhizobium endolithicum]CAD6420570.1 hypothetical protein REQ54_02119 [Rhizobium sp. Q54]CAD7026816.1 hypothetical protein REJC140_02421 [Pseudorhizobium endolithicum]
MTKSLTPVAAALIASAAFGTAALASGEYYQGLYPEAAATVDTFQTSSVREASTAPRQDAAVQVAGETVDHGDYYEGATRPN